MTPRPSGPSGPGNPFEKYRGPTICGLPASEVLRASEGTSMIRRTGRGNPIEVRCRVCYRTGYCDERGRWGKNADGYEYGDALPCLECAGTGKVYSRFDMPLPTEAEFHRAEMLPPVEEF